MNRTLNSVDIYEGKHMNQYMADGSHAHTRRMEMRRWFRKLGCFSIGLLVLVAPALSFAKGGDVKWQYRDVVRGKQEISASVTDSASNVIAVGYTGYRNATSLDEDYWIAKFRADGSGMAWRASYDRLGGADRAVAVATDASNDVIVTGYAWNGTNNDIHTIKYNGSTGSVIWADTFSGGGNDIATSIVVDKVNNDIYVGGYQQNAAGNDDYLIVKYDNAGSGPANTPLQVLRYNGAANGPDRLMSIAAGIDGVAVTGQSWNGQTFDSFTLKYDFAGTQLREWRYQAARGVTGNYVAMDAQGNVLIAATVEGEIDRDAYFAKYAAGTGMTTWQTTYNGVFDDVPTGIYVDGVGDLYITGYTWTAEGDHDILTMRYNGTTVNPNGHLIWKKTFNSALENSDIASPTGIVVDEALYGDVFVTGYSIANGVSDFQTVKYKKENGNILWSRSFNGPENRSDRPATIMLTVDQGVSVIGWSDNTKVLAQGSDANPLTPLDGGEAAATGGTATSIVNTAKGWVTNQWAGYIVRMTSGANSGAERYIATNTATTLSVVTPFSSPVTAGDTYFITGSKSSLTDTTKAWTSGEWAGFHVRMTSGANAGAVRRVIGNTAATLTVDMDFGSVAAVGDEYQLFDKEDYDTYLIKYDRGRINRPTDLTAEAVAKAANGTYTIRIAWTDNSANEEGFRVERRLGENGTWEPVATLPPGTTEYLDMGLAEGNYYYYRVWAFNAATVTDPDYSNEDHALAVLVSFNQPTWTHLYNSEYNLEDYATAIATGPDDHPVVTGKSDSDLIGMYDYYTIKLNRATSAATWSSRYDSMQNEMDIANCLSIDNSNNVYVSGYSSLYFDPVEANINSVYTVKYPAAGPPAAWGAQYNGPGGIDDRSVAVTSTTDGSSIVVAGYGKNAAGNEDIYLIRYAASPPFDQFGNALPLWSAAPFDGGGDDFPTAVAIAPDGNIFVSGYRHNGADFDLFLAKYNGATGALIWSDSYHGGSGDDRGLSLALDALGDAYVAGFVTNAQGNRDYVVAKYTGSYDYANREWIHAFDGPAQGDDSVAAVRIDPVDGHVVIAGTSLTATGDNDIRLIRFTPLGAFVWQRTLQRPGSDEICTSMAIDYSGNIFVAGSTGDGTTTDALSVKYTHDGTIIDAARYDGPAGSFDETSAIAVNTLGEAFFAGYTINGSGNADYLVYRMGAEQLPAPYPFVQQPLYTTVALTWADKSSVEDGFVIKRRTGICIADDSDGSWVTIATQPANSTSYTDTTTTPGTLYCYRINSYKGSVPSRAVKREVTTLIPPAPADFTAMPIDTTTIGLSWTDTTTGETQFRFERCTGASCTDFALLASVAGNGTSYTDSTVCSGTVYRYRITAVGTNWTSGQAVTSGLSPTPVSPAALSASRVSEAEIRLQWTDASSDETGFQIERCMGVGCENFATVDTVTADVTAYNDRFGLNADTAYRYRVRTVKAAACPTESAPSAVAEAVTTLSVPTGLATAAASTTQVNLSWTDTTASETGFAVERCSGAGCDFGTLDAGFPVLLNYNVTAWNDTSVCNSATYSYRVKAVDRGLPLGGGGTWTKRAPLTISNFQPEFQTRVVVPYAAGMKLDFGDIRFFDERGNIQLPYWLETKVDGVSATFWVKTRSTNTLYLYYGNPSATSAARGTDTFEFFDDFAGTAIDTAKWTVVNGGTLYRQNNEFISTGGTVAWDSGMYSVQSFARPFVFEVDQYLTGGSNIMLGTKDATAGTSYVDYVYAGYVTGASNQLYVYEDGSSRGYRSLTIPFNTWRTFRFDVLTTGAGYSQGASSGTMTKYYDSAYSSESPLRIGFANNNMAFRWDNARVRKYAAAAPVAAIGAEQAAPAFIGAWESGYSGVSQITLPTPGTPSELTATRVTEAEIKLTWKRNSTDESGFHIERCTGAGCDFSSRITLTVAPGTTEYNDVDVTFGSTYTYRLSAFKNASCGWETEMSGTASAATTLLPPAAPAATASVGNDCNELRFMDDNAVSLNYYIESGCNTAATRIWLRVPSIPVGSKQVFLYTANPPATGVSNPSGVFDFYEDFSGTTINGAKWIEVDTTANYLTQNNGLIASGGVSSWGSVGLYTISNFPRPFVMEAGHYRTGGNSMALGLKDTSVNVGLTYFPHLSYPIYDGSGNRLRVYESGSISSDNLRAIQSDTWQYYRLDALPNSGAKYYHGNSLLSLTSFYESTNNSASTLKVGLINYNQVFKMNMVRVRKYANPEPVAALTPEQYGDYLLAEGSWYARRPITITNPGPQQNDYQIAVTVDTTSSAADRIILGWTDTAGTETGYMIERCAGAGCSFATPTPVTFQTPANATGYTDWDVTNGSTYCYRVKAVRDGVWTAPWTDAICAATQPAVAPTNLAAAPSETKVELTWTDTTVGENGFRIERCTGAGCDFSSLDPGFPVTVPVNSTSYTDTAVCSNTYRYRIQPFKVGPGGWTALYSNIADAVTRLPAAPSALTATRASETQINLSWTDNTGDETGFTVERCEGAGCTDFASIATVAADVKIYASIGLKPDTTYRYRVKAFRTAGCGWESPYSNVSEATTTVVVPPAPVITAPNTTQVNMSWTDNTVAETSFAIQRCTGSTCDFSTLDPGFPVELPAGSTAWNDLSVCSGVAYRYRVAVRNDGLTQNGGGGWTRRKPITFTNFKADFITRLVLPYDPDMKADFSDIRFYDQGAYRELPYWIESKVDGASATVWIRTSLTEAVHLYYGNAAATATGSMTAVFGAGVMGSWPVNEVNGTVSGNSSDLSGQGNNVSLTGFIGPYGVISAGRYGNGISLDGIDDFLKKDAVTLPTGSVATIEAWIYPKGYGDPSYNGIVSYGNRSSRDSLLLSIQNTGRPSMATWNNDFVPSSGAVATLNAWNHIAVTVSGTSVALYMNGQAIPGTLTYTPNFVSKNLSIGATDYPGRMFNGYIDEVRIYNRALSAAEIASRYAATLPVVQLGVEEESSAFVFAAAYGDRFSTSAGITTPAYKTPASLSATRSSDIQINLSWSDTNTDETGFRIERCEGAGCTSFEEIDMVGFGVGSYFDTNRTANLKPNTLYRYRVRAYKTASCGWQSNYTAIAQATTSVTAPGSLAASASSTTTINLTWTDQSVSETGFAVERCIGASCDFTDKTTFLVGPNITAWTDSSVCRSTTYRYRVMGTKRGLSLDGDAVWTRRAPLTITDFQQNFQTKVTVQYAEGMRPDFADIRFFDATASTELPYWIESKTDGGAAVVWIRTGKNNNIWLYYGNSAASSAANGATVFDFFDDFNGTAIDTTRWNVISGTGFTVSDGNLHGTNTTGRITSRTTFSSGIVQEVKAKATSIAPNGQMMAGFYNYINNNIGFLNHPGSAYYSTNGAWTSYGIEIPASNMLYTLAVKDSSTVNLKVYNLDVPTAFWNAGDISNPVAGEAIAIGRRYDSDIYNGQTYAADWDWVRVRKYAALEPAVTIGGVEQSAGFTFAILWDSAYSGIVSATTPTPGTPGGFTATASTDTRINLVWADNTMDEDGFRIEQCSTGACSADADFSPIAFTAPNVTSYAVEGLVPSSRYCFRARAVKAASCGWETDYSPVSCDISFSAHPINLRAEPAGSFRVVLNWDDVSSDEDGFEVQTQAWNGEWVNVSAVGTNITTYTVRFGIDPLTTYRYRVRAFRGGDNSPFSNEDDATTPAYTTTDSTCK